MAVAERLRRLPWLWRRRLLAVMTLLAVVTFVALDSWRRDHLFLINATGSLPNWAFLVDRTQAPARGSIVIFVVPVTSLIRRHFGAAPPPFAKRVYGVAGDQVSRIGFDVFVSGKWVARVKSHSRLGEPLLPGPTGTVPRHCLFVATSHPDSFDSRYADIGWICRDRILGIGRPIL